MLAASPMLSWWRRLVIELGTCRCARRAAARNVIPGKGRHFAEYEVFFGAHRFAASALFGDQEAIGGNGETGVVMKPFPASTLVVAQPQLLFEFLVVAFDTPAHLRRRHQLVDGGLLGQRG